MTEQKTLIGEVPAETIEQWKKEHQDVYKVVVADRVVYFKRPNRYVLGLIESTSQDNYRAAEILFENCCLGGDKDFVRNDEHLFTSVAVRLGKIIEFARTTIVKL